MKNLSRLISIIMLLLMSSLLNAQGFGITDKSGGITPANLLQVHKTGTASSILMQLSNDATGGTSVDGLQFGIDASKNGFFENNSTGASIFIGPSPASSAIAEFKSNGNVNIKGDLTYNLIQGESYAEDVDYTPALTKNVYAQLQPGMTVNTNNGLTYTNSNNNITILTAGNYRVDMVITFDGNDNDDFRVKMYEISPVLTAFPGSSHIVTRGANHYATLTYFWYASLAANEVIGFYIGNLTNNDDPTVTDMKVYIAKDPK